MWVTIQDCIDAAEKNGLTWIKGTYLNDYNDGLAQEGCALGQMAYNLECDPAQLHTSLDNLILDKETHYHINLGSAIVRENDGPDTESYEEVVEFIHNLLDKYKDKKILLRKVEYHK